LNSEDLQKECVEVFKIKYADEYVKTKDNEDNNGPVLSSASLGGSCGWRYYLCSAAATSAAILCDGACISASVGLGTPACVVLWASIQTFALVQCADTYCPQTTEP
jgi:hypothetical protein